jgi:sugar/nucleoside kinase (ribokinase family)
MYRDIIVKPNAREAALAAYPQRQGEQIDREIAQNAAQDLYYRNGRPVYLTVGADGIIVFDREGMTHVPGIDVEGPIDIVGAGDSTMAGIVSALCCGATHSEAAQVGCLVASITIQQIGTTGTATREQVLARYRETVQ